MSGLIVSTLFDGLAVPAPDAQPRIGVVRGEGIGPSVVDASLAVLQSVIEKYSLSIDLDFAPEANTRDDYGLVIDDRLRDFYLRCFEGGVPIVHGPAGGRYVYQLRTEFDLPIKLTPIQPFKVLGDISIVRLERVIDTDLLIVRDNSAGLYQGNFGWRDEKSVAFHEARYDREQANRVLHVAIRAAQQRSGRLAVVVKPGGIPTISALWRESAELLAPSDLSLEFVEIDNACFQLIADPNRFDVLVAPNMFGDVLGDTASVLLGSRGLSYSANFGLDGRAVYQTAHGAAHDLVGRNRANPIAQILTLAWLLRDSFGHTDAASAIHGAVQGVLARGVRTLDIASPTSAVVSTDEMAREIADHVRGH